MHKRTVKHTN